MVFAAPPKHLPTRARQFGAVLRKNYLLQTRSRRLWIGGAGWLALLIEVRARLDNDSAHIVALPARTEQQLLAD